VAPRLVVARLDRPHRVDPRLARVGTLGRLVAADCWQHLRPMRRIATGALTAVVLLAAGCGGAADAPGPARDPAEAPRPAPRASAQAPPAATEAPSERARVQRAHCAAGAANCAAVTGSVLYVEAVDPDGDGDAHYVLAGGHVTAPGLSIIDVERTLRPRRLPRAGELVSAAGPVYTGSHGQRQIQAVELHHQRH
jgi:hypothetical protein